MLAADLVAAAARRIDALLGVRVTASDVDPRCWLKVDSVSLIQGPAAPGLPLAGDSVPLGHSALLSAGGHVGGRPEFYDFDLFAHATEATTAQGDTASSPLNCRVSRR